MRETSEYMADLTIVLIVQAETGFTGEPFGLIVKQLSQIGRQLLNTQVAQSFGELKDRVPYRRVGDGAEVPYSPCQPNIKKVRDECCLLFDCFGRIVGSERCQQGLHLQGESPILVVPYGLPPGSDGARRLMKRNELTGIKI